MGRRGISAFILQPSPLQYCRQQVLVALALWVIGLVVILTGLGFVIAAVNAAIPVVFAMGRPQALPGPLTRLSRHQTPVVAISYLAVITLPLGLPLTHAGRRNAHLRLPRRTAGLRWYWSTSP